MKKKYVRIGFTQAQKNELWERWRRSEQMKSIGREFGKPHRVFSNISVQLVGSRLFQDSANLWR